MFTDKATCDRNFEALTRRLLDARPLVRVAIGSHNLRSIAHAIACNRLAGGRDEDLELQVLRGLGDELATALARRGARVRMYAPVGDLVAGMAYLVRRLLENTSNESFLLAQEQGVPLEQPAGGAVTPAAVRQRADARAARRRATATRCATRSPRSTPACRSRSRS